MSTYDQLIADARARKRRESADGKSSIGLVEAFDLLRIARAIDRAREKEGQPLSAHEALPDYAGQTAALLRDGKKIGDHGLVMRDGDRHYLAHHFVAGRALPLLLCRRSFWRAADQERSDLATFGDEVAIDVQGFARRFIVRCASSAQVKVLLTDELVGALMVARRVVRRVTLEPGLEGIHVDVLARADDGREAIPAIALARAVHAAVEAVASTAGGFVATARAEVSNEQRIPELLDDVRAATAFLGGHVERVGDAAEARMTLDEPAGWRGALRVAFAAGRSLSVTFDGELSPPFTSNVTLRPERSRLERARGLFDKKLGDPELDRAFLIEGNLDAARLLASETIAALALVSRGATLSLDANGVHVRIPDLPDEDEALLEATSASLALWRAAAHERAGIDEAKASLG
jgi:hypothetical protein